MAFKFLACTLRSSYPAFASSMLDLWYEYEKGESPAAILVRQVDKLECMHQAVIYEERDGINLEEFMLLSEKVTLPQLGPLRDACLQKHKELTDGPYNNVQIIFVSGRHLTVYSDGHSNQLTLLRRAGCWEGDAVRPACKRVWISSYLCWRLVTGGSKMPRVTI